MPGIPPARLPLPRRRLAAYSPPGRGRRAAGLDPAVRYGGEQPRRWCAADPRLASLVEEVRQRFSGLSAPAREAAIELAMVLLHPGEGEAPLPAPLLEAGGKLLTAAAPCGDGGVRVRVLALADVL